MTDVQTPRPKLRRAKHSAIARKNGSFSLSGRRTAGRWGGSVLGGLCPGVMSGHRQLQHAANVVA